MWLFNLKARPFLDFDAAYDTLWTENQRFAVRRRGRELGQRISDIRQVGDEKGVLSGRESGDGSLQPGGLRFGSSLHALSVVAQLRLWFRIVQFRQAYGFHG